MSQTAEEIKLEALMEDFGFDAMEPFLRVCAVGAICPAICMNDGCDYTDELEPDQDKGFCEDCGTNTMVSALILAGIF